MQPLIRTCSLAQHNSLVQLSSRAATSRMVASMSIAWSLERPGTTQNDGQRHARDHPSSLLGKCVGTRKAPEAFTRAACCRQIRALNTAAMLPPKTTTVTPRLESTPPLEWATTPISFLRSFSTSFRTLRPSCLSSPDPTFSGYVWSRYPRLRSEDTPGRPSDRSRRHPSPLFDRPSPTPPPPPPSPNPGGPWRRPPSSSSSSSSFLGGLIALVDQRFFSRLPDRFVLYTIIALNILVFLMWLYAREALRKFSDPRPFIFLTKNFLSGWINVSEGRWWTMLTSCISHEGLDHLLLNMVSLSFMAPPVIALTGPTTFLLLYFGAGMVTSAVSMLAKKVIIRENNTPGAIFAGFSHGASGSAYAIMTAFACVHPTSTFLLFFVIPTPAWACISCIFAWDLWHATITPQHKTDSAGHIGGILAGLLFWKFGLKGFRAP